jgi:hypothetical protein
VTFALTKTEQVLEVLRAGGRAEPGRGDNQGVWRLFDADGKEVPAWNNAIKTAAAIKDNQQ